MSGFNETWLTLREPADHAARNHELEQALNDLLRERDAISILDLGAGTGSNLRHLAPRLNAQEQTWTLIDNDAELLDCLPDRLSTLNATVADDGSRYPVMSLNVDARQISINRQQIDLANGLTNGLTSIDFSTHDIITGSALLDLAGEDWLTELAKRCIAANVTAYFVLSYDGHSEWSPTQPDDSAVLDRFNQHQKQDKGLGVSLGPDAAAYLVEQFWAGGYTVQTGTSDWKLTPEQGALQQELESGIARAVAELDPEFAERSEAWFNARRDSIARGVAQSIIGHVDLLASPAR